MQTSELAYIDVLTRFLRACGGSQEEWLCVRHLKGELGNEEVAHDVVAHAIKLHLVDRQEVARDQMRTEYRLKLTGEP